MWIYIHILTSTNVASQQQVAHFRNQQHWNTDKFYIISDICESMRKHTLNHTTYALATKFTPELQM